MECEGLWIITMSCVVTIYHLSAMIIKNNQGRSYPYSPEMHINNTIFPKKGR